MKAFSFKAKRKYLPVELPDGSEITLPGPKKKIMDVLSSLTEYESMDQVYEVIAMILSTNLESRKFSVSDVDEMLEVTDIFEFMQVYTEFVKGTTEGKN